MTSSPELQGRGTVLAPAAPRLSVETTSITFGSAKVLRDVHLEVQPGEIHALIGQNGSGKSTLAKILTGLYTPDAGARVSVDGVDIKLPVSPNESRLRGVAVVHQSLGLVDDATVIENTRVGRLSGSRFLRRIDWKAERAATAAVFERLGRSIDLDAKVGALREDERATVAIARALQDVQPGEGLIILDESTRALGRQALEHFFEILDGIVATGTAALLITHRLEEVVDAADRVTVLRDGRVVESGCEVAGLDRSDLAAMMLGRNVDDLERRDHAVVVAGAEPIRVTGLTGLGVTDISFTVRPGEVVGLAGLGGSGYDDVPYLLAGVSRASSGTVVLPSGECQAARLSPASANRAGMALVPEGRDTAGLAMGMSITDNLSFPQTCTSKRAVVPVPRARERALAEHWIARLDVRPPRPEAVVGTMSGGNQQKVLLAKWLATDPHLLLLHEPTQAVDVGARHTIVQAVRAAARDGRAVVVAGSDENELALLCDRVLVFSNGAISQELTEEITPHAIVGAIYTNGARNRLRQTRTSTTSSES